MSSNPTRYTDRFVCPVGHSYSEFGLTGQEEFTFLDTVCTAHHVTV